MSLWAFIFNGLAVIVLGVLDKVVLSKSDESLRLLLLLRNAPRISADASGLNSLECCSTKDITWWLKRLFRNILHF